MEAEREAIWEARLRLETATARRKGRQEGLEHYRDAFIHYFPDQLPEDLDRHFSDAFPYAQTYAQLSPLLRHGVPAPEVSEMEADPEENADLRGVGFSKHFERKIFLIHNFSD